jgi:transposase
MNYSGIDLHSNNSVITVIDETDRVVAEKRLPNDLTKILAFLAPWKCELAGVVIESTFNWYWLVDGLQAAGFTVHLAHTTAVRQYDGLKHSGDETDVRDLARKRMQLVRSRTSHLLAIENITARHFGTRISSSQVLRLTAEAIDQMGLPAEVALAMQANLAVVTTLSAQIELLEKRLAEKVRPRAEYALLTSVPGIGQILASVILLEIGSIERFASAGNFASYARCVDSQHTSNGRKKGEGNTRNGNRYLSWAFVEAANFAQRYCAEAKRFYERKKARTNPIVARKALAHKLARACFHILKEHKPFDVTRCFT